MDVRFLHTADWQLGMRRHFLAEEALPRFMQDRIDAIVRLGALAEKKGCEFVAVCGDVFESNQVDPRTIGRALDALATIRCPVFLLPGNHDPLDAATLYRARAFVQPPHVHVLDSGVPVEVRPGLEVVGAPWPSKRPGRDLVAAACESLEPTPGVLRVMLAHGAILPPKPQIDRTAAEEALADGRIHFLALGDRHSTTRVAERIWYSGAPEATDYTETDPGNVLVVELGAGSCRVQPHRIGRWRFARRTVELDRPEDIDALAAWIDGQERKDCTIVKLDLSGSLALRDRARLELLLDRAASLFAGLERKDGLTLRPDDGDLRELGLAGFARTTMERLVERKDETAQDALALLYRLAR